MVLPGFAAREAEGEVSNLARAIQKAGIFVPASEVASRRLKLAWLIRRKSCRIMVSAVGLGPTTHALKVLLTVV